MKRKYIYFTAIQTFFSYVNILLCFRVVKVTSTYIYFNYLKKISDRGIIVFNVFFSFNTVSMV